MIIRNAERADAERLVNLIADAEKSGFMMFEPGERQISPEQLSKRIEAMEQDDKSAILLADDDGELKGYLFIIGNSPQRRSHSVYLAIGIGESSRGQGVGTTLFEQLDTWAIEKGIRRLELTVMIHNRAGVALYQKAGFKIEGIKKNSLKVNGEYIDEYYMAKLLG
ncbi:GNAT family N-acetyltransferase [Planococcus halotolerans]|uniref:GNAT family N-acetyltransferase n=1 Tax=Planococcus halotolerans TaxID=2233542 RepID=UPI001092FDBE|nr:GNAT family N-acetyltransferase [Planococcus halotolerans]QHJ71232.1 GNAT family N-acetyltransferase [Planococcus halotolerans]